MKLSQRRVSVLLFVVALVLNLRAQLPPPDAQIAGRVVRADNGAPIEGAIIGLAPNSAADFVVAGNFHSQTTKSDGNGEYYFQGLKNGAYTIGATSAGFVRAEYRRNASPGGEILTVDASTRLRGVDFRLTREAVIRGVVIDVEGRHIGPGVFVAAVRWETRGDGLKRLSLVSDTYTDGAGHFALKGLLPGSYFVCVDGPSGYEVHPDPGGWYKESWYGDKPSEKGALQITLKEGSERDGIQIKVKRETRYRVIICAKGPRSESTTDSYDFDLLQREAWEVKHIDGNYVIPNIPPGHYTLVIHAPSGGHYIAQAERHFDVVDRDVTLRIHFDGAVDK